MGDVPFPLPRLVPGGGSVWYDGDAIGETPACPAEKRFGDGGDLRRRGYASVRPGGRLRVVWLVGGVDGWEGERIRSVMVRCRS